MPRYEGVYEDGRGGWYFKLTVGHHPLTGKRSQITKRGFRSAAEAAQARRDCKEQGSGQAGAVAATTLTIGDLLDLYLDGLDTDKHLATKTRFDYRSNADAYIRPWLGDQLVRDLNRLFRFQWGGPN